MMRSHPPTTAVVLALTAIALGGCGDDADAAKSVTVELVDYSFNDVPRTIRADTRLAATNSSAGEAHELTALRLPDDETRPLADLKALPPGDLAALTPGAPALAITAAPRARGDLVLGDGTLAQPGRYLLVCFIPVGAKPDEVLAAMRAAAEDPAAGPPRIDGGPPHLSAGMITEITVTA